MTDLGVDASCQNNPPPVQNDYSSLLWIIAGIAAIGGGYYLYNRQEKKSKYPAIPPKTPQKPTGYTAKKK